MQCFISYIKRYAGTFALLFKDNNNTIILHDARALREIYYCTMPNQIVCGSQPNLITKFSNPEIQPTSNPDLLDFYKNHLWDSRWIGDETYFESVKHLLPNHYFDITNHEVRRYWPNEPIKPLPLAEAVSRSCKFLQGIMKAIVHRHSVIMAVTAGTDSRTLLAASRGIQNKMYHFVNNSGLGFDHPDIYVPQSMLNSLEIPFHVQEVPTDVDDEFRKVFFNNTFLATECLLPAIYNVFFKNHDDKTCILGVGEIGRNFYGKEPKNLNAYRMAYLLKYKKCHYVIKQCEKIMADILPVARESGINVLDLFYWEQRLGNWGAVRNSESCIAIEKVDPYDSHMLCEIFLGVDEKYKNYQETPCVLFREIIRNMWPDLLEWPINPPFDIRDKVTGLLLNVGIFHQLKELKYQLNYLLHHCQVKI